LPNPPKFCSQGITKEPHTLPETAAQPLHATTSNNMRYTTLLLLLLLLLSLHSPFSLLGIHV
jgi:hypothetical protein